MIDSEKSAFAELIAGVYAYHRAPISPAVIGVFWNGCKHWSLEQVRHAIDMLTRDAEAGKFPPKIGDMTRVLEGTHTDRSILAWGRTLEAMRSIGAYTDVIFDDPATHAAIEDVGGWPKLCRTSINDLGYVQTAFCKAHKAYVGRGTFDYPLLVSGERDADSVYEKYGVPIPTPALVGDPKLCALVYEGGKPNGKTPITFASFGALAALALPHRQPGNDDVSDAMPHRVGGASCQRVLCRTSKP